jgi:hypothetical protein
VKRSILLALVAALVLAVGFSPSAGAGVGDDAQISAKKGAKCAKGAKGKAKGSANASAKGKKGKGCKWPPSDGTYSDSRQNGISLILSDDASRADMSLPSALAGTCLPLPMQTGDVPATVRASSLSASGTATAGSSVVQWSATWKITVKADLSYVATVDSKTEGLDEDPCSKHNTFKGKLVKQG